MGVEESELACSKDEFCKALQAERLLIDPRYESRPHRYEWFREQRVFADNGYPSQGPGYDGDPDPGPQYPNAESVLDRCFNLTIYESWSDEEVADIVAAFEKVATAYAQ